LRTPVAVEVEDRDRELDLKPAPLYSLAVDFHALRSNSEGRGALIG
jgi:hypothetical protein